MSLVPSAQAGSLISIQKRAGSVPHLEFLLSGPRGWYCSYIVFYTETKSGLYVLYYSHIRVTCSSSSHST